MSEIFQTANEKFDENVVEFNKFLDSRAEIRQIFSMVF
jgi:hypothetical protein